MKVVANKNAIFVDKKNAFIKVYVFFIKKSRIFIRDHLQHILKYRRVGIVILYKEHLK